MLINCKNDMVDFIHVFISLIKVQPMYIFFLFKKERKLTCLIMKLIYW